jgi:hypothetical protein
MKLQALVLSLVVFTVLALPAAASPPTRVARPTSEVAQLRAKIKKLTTANAKLAHANKVLRADNENLNALTNNLHRQETALQEHILMTDPCPITHPNQSQPPGPTFGSQFEGNGSLWVGLWKPNVVVWPPDPDGVIRIKFGWWRAVTGKLEINGRRVDGAAPSLTADIPDGYGGTGFQATTINFPTAGCWRVTGSVANTSLTFITLVLAA